MDEYRVIGEFDGWIFNEAGTECYDSKQPRDKFEDRPLWLRVDILRNYEDDWNWLMSVVEKIETMNFNVLIGFGNSCVIIEKKREASKAIKFESSEMIKEDDKIYTKRPKTKIKAVYTAVIQFITWYNQTKTPHND